MADSDVQKDPRGANGQGAAESAPPQPADSVDSNGERAAGPVDETETPEAAPDDGDDATEDDAEQSEAVNSDAQEAPAEEPAEEPAEPSLEEQLDAAKKETQATKERMLRIAADFENFRKRARRDADAARKRGMQSAVRELLPVFDNLERAAGHGIEATDAKSIADGVRMVQKMFIDTVAKLDIERIDALGKPFDPMVHEGIQHDYSDDYEAGSIMTVFHPGYTMGKDLLRPALVVVSRGPKPPDPPPAEDSETAEEPASEPAECAPDEEHDSAALTEEKSTATADDESGEGDADPDPSSSDEE